MSNVDTAMGFRGHFAAKLHYGTHVNSPSKLAFVLGKIVDGIEFWSEASGSSSWLFLWH